MAEFVMPSLGADMEAGTLIAWLKKPGEVISRGEIIAEIDTDKGVIEVECFTSGVIEKLLVQPGAEVPVGTLLAIIREAREVAPAEVPPAAQEQERLKISPLARKTAESLGVDPAGITGSGPGGRITREDIERAAAKPVAPPADQSDPGARMRQVIAAAMARSKREIPHYYLGTSIDMTSRLEWLATENLKRPVEKRLLYGVLLIEAVARALKKFPDFNGWWTDGRFVQSPEINIGVAVSLRGGGLVAPAILSADRMSLDRLMEAFRDLVQRARSGRLRSSELTGSTITVTSLGEQGVDSVFGIIYPPQVALVGFGRIVERPWAVDGMIGVRRVVQASLAADHRVTDGHHGGLFLAEIAGILSEPATSPAD